MQTETTTIDRDREFDQTAKTEPPKCFYCDWPIYHGHKMYCPNNLSFSKTPEEFLAAYPGVDSEFTRKARSETAKTVTNGWCRLCIGNGSHMSDCPNSPASIDRELIESLKDQLRRERSSHVSPAILEFRNQELDAENRDLKEKLRVADVRITGFENFYASFARKVDEFEMMFMNLTGSTAGEFAKRVDRKRGKRRRKPRVIADSRSIDHGRINTD